MLIALLNLIFLGEGLQLKEEHDTVREHDNLPCLLDQAPRDSLSPPVVDR